MSIRSGGSSDVIVHALYDFDYETVEGKKVWLREGEELQLLKKTNGDWWQVLRNGEKRPFYAPANYVEQVSATLPRNNRRPRLSSSGAAPTATSSLIDSGSSDVNSNGSICVSLSSLDTTLLPPSPKLLQAANNTHNSADGSVKSLANLMNQSVLNQNKKAPFKSNNNGNAVLKNRPPTINEINIPTGSESPAVTVSNALPSSEGITVEQCKLLGRSSYQNSGSGLLKKDCAIREETDNEEVKRLMKEDRTNNNSCCGNKNEQNNAESRKESQEINRVSSVNGDHAPIISKIISATTTTLPKKVPSKLLMRPRPPSPVYANFPLITSPIPPSPQRPRLPLRCFDGGWAEFEDPNTGRKFYYNVSTEEKTWKPPRKTNYGENKPSSLNLSKDSNRHSNGSVRENGHNSDVQLLHCPTPTSINMPPGWTKSSDSNSGETCFVNDSNNERWFTSADDRGRIYYYKENGVESFWQLPNISTEDCNQKNSGRLSTSLTTVSSPSLLESHVRQRPNSPGSPPNSVTPRRRPLSMADRNNKTRSMVLVEPRFIVNEELRDGRSSTLPKSLTTPNISRLPNEVLRGTLCKTKLSEAGKKMRKNWTVSHAVLTDQSLYFFKELKNTEINPTKAELRIELLGAAVEWALEKSSRKNVFQITTITGTDLQILLQEDDCFTAKRWFDAISSSIRKLPSGFEFATMKLEAFDENRKFQSLNRKLMTKKLDKKGSVGNSVEDLDCTQIEKKSKIRDKLRNFFIRRPTLESLREKGIIKEELVFGCNLETLCNREKTTIPKFVQRCVAAIEERDVTADGLYRASGNLSQVQRIRFQINQDNWNILNEEEDIHVLTGALKMFFRELKEPLFPIDTFGKFLNAIALPDRKSKLQSFGELLASFPQCNYCTLTYLLEHLLRVTTYSDQNRMHIQNLAIVFGPTLMWSSTDPASIALDVIHQNQIVEFLLLEFDAIFR